MQDLYMIAIGAVIFSFGFALTALGYTIMANVQETRKFNHVKSDK